MFIKDKMCLINARTGEAVNIGDTVHNALGEAAQVSGGHPPRHAKRDGLVFVRVDGGREREYPASTYGCRWDSEKAVREIMAILGEESEFEPADAATEARIALGE